MMLLQSAWLLLLTFVITQLRSAQSLTLGSHGTSIVLGTANSNSTHNGTSSGIHRGSGLGKLPSSPPNVRSRTTDSSSSKTSRGQLTTSSSSVSFKPLSTSSGLTASTTSSAPASSTSSVAAGIGANGLAIVALGRVTDLKDKEAVKKLKNNMLILIGKVKAAKVHIPEIENSKGSCSGGGLSLAHLFKIMTCMVDTLTDAAKNLELDVPDPTKFTDFLQEFEAQTEEEQKRENEEDDNNEEQSASNASEQGSTSFSSIKSLSETTSITHSSKTSSASSQSSSVAFFSSSVSTSSSVSSSASRSNSTTRTMTSHSSSYSSSSISSTSSASSTATRYLILPSDLTDTAAIQKLAVQVQGLKDLVISKDQQGNPSFWAAPLTQNNITALQNDAVLVPDEPMDVDPPETTNPYHEKQPGCELPSNGSTCRLPAGAAKRDGETSVWTSLWKPWAYNAMSVPLQSYFDSNMDPEQVYKYVYDKRILPGQGTRVYLIDNGVNMFHQEFASRAHGGPMGRLGEFDFDWIFPNPNPDGEGQWEDENGQWIDYTTDYENPDAPPSGANNNLPNAYTDSTGHGTQMASLIMGDTLGVAPGCRLTVVKLPRYSNGPAVGKIPSFAIARMGTLMYSAVREDSQISKNVVSMSYNFEARAVARQKLLQGFTANMRTLRVSFVVSSGNQKAGQDNYPIIDSYPAKIIKPPHMVVGSIDLNGQRSPFSCGSEGDGMLSTSAPGRSIKCAYNSAPEGRDVGYTLSPGTSPATALTAGLAAYYLGFHTSADGRADRWVYDKIVNGAYPRVSGGPKVVWNGATEPAWQACSNPSSRRMFKRDASDVCELSRSTSTLSTSSTPRSSRSSETRTLTSPTTSKSSPTTSSSFPFSLLNGIIGEHPFTPSGLTLSPTSSSPTLSIHTSSSPPPAPPPPPSSSTAPQPSSLPPNRQVIFWSLTCLPNTCTPTLRGFDVPTLSSSDALSSACRSSSDKTCPVSWSPPQPGSGGDPLTSVVVSPKFVAAHVFGNCVYKSGGAGTGGTMLCDGFGSPVQCLNPLLKQECAGAAWEAIATCPIYVAESAGGGYIGPP